MERLEFLRSIKKIALASIFSDPNLFNILVLKGGNLLDLGYELSGRASVDLDFSMADNFSNLGDVEKQIENLLIRGFERHGFVLFDFTFQEVPPKISDNMKEFWGGYKIEFKIIEIDKHKAFKGSVEKIRRNAVKIGYNQSSKFKIDISRHEYCDEKEIFEVDGQKFYGYSPRVFLAEKLRAICQQMKEYVDLVHSNPSPRPRDFVDIHILSTHYGISWNANDFQSTIQIVFDKKRVPITLIENIRDTREFHINDFPSVTATVLPEFHLEDFDFYFDFLCKRCEELKPLWHK